MKLRFLMPLLGLAALALVLGMGLTGNPRQVPSPLIGQRAPAFELPLVAAPSQRFAATGMQGQVWLLNVWASWCVACRAEHDVLLALEASGRVPIVGLDYKDNRINALQYLDRHGDPFKLSVYDPEGQVAMNFGVYGVPETYVIGPRGVILYKQIGPLTPNVLQNEILPLVEELSQ